MAVHNFIHQEAIFDKYFAEYDDEDATGDYNASDAMMLYYLKMKSMRIVL